MKQGLQLRLSQQLAMTPQLQQAIRLLQLSTLELQQELQQALESNPLLEQTDLHDEVEAKEVEDRESLDTVDALEQKEMPDELLSMPAGMKSIPPVRRQATAWIIRTTSCPSIKAKPLRRCRII